MEPSASDAVGKGKEEPGVERRDGTDQTVSEDEEDEGEEKEEEEVGVEGEE